MTSLTFHEPPRTHHKDPDEVIRFTIDWSQWLKADTISSSEWVVPAGITEDSSSNTTTTTTITLSSGLSGTRYPIVNRITTAAGLKKEKPLIVKVLDTRYTRLAR